MTEMTWELLTKVYDRIEAEMMKAATPNAVTQGGEMIRQGAQQGEQN